MLALFQHSAAGQRLREQLDAILLVDREPPDGSVPLEQGVLLPPTTIESASDLARLVLEHHITEVIDLSSIDTLDCTRVCDELGAHFLCTSVEEWPWRGSIPTDEAIARLIPPRRPALSRRSHLVGDAPPGDDVFAMTWSPAHCLEELFEPRAFAAAMASCSGWGTHRPSGVTGPAAAIASSREWPFRTRRR